MSKYYAVRRGRSTGIFSTWAECSSQVTGFKGAVFKKFNTQAEAAAFVKGSGGYTPAPSSTGPIRSRPAHSTPYERSGHIATFPTKRESHAASSKREEPHGRAVTSYVSDATFRAMFGNEAADRLPPGPKPMIFDGVDDDFVPNPSASTRVTEDKRVVPVGDTPGITVIYTDGSSLGNGRAGSRAGYGVWFGDNDPRNVAAAVQGAQTNNAGELMAIKVALDIIKSEPGNYVIKSDSSYSLDSVTKWADRWERNGWQTANGKPVQNQRVIMDIRKSLKECKARGVFVTLEKVKGHANVYGNEMADRLARQGASSR